MGKEKVAIYRKWWFWVVIILIIIFILSVTFILNNSKKGVGTAGISKQEFDEIQIGITTNFELNNIIDKNNEWNDNAIYDKCVEQISEEEKKSKYTYVYKYYGEKGGYAIITLEADYSNGYLYNDVIVIEKENYGLK